MKRDINRLKKLITSLFIIPLIALTGISCDSDNNVTDPNEIESVLEVSSSRDDLATLVGLASDAGVTNALDNAQPITLFAPTNQAFENLPAGALDTFSNQELANILSYHILSEEALSDDLLSEQTGVSISGEAIYITVNSSNEVSVNAKADVTEADLEASNGVVHIIDEVILPNSYLNVADIAQKNYELDTLVGLLADNGMVSTLESDGSFTVFAPTNAAFADAQNTLESLSPQQVEEVLQYHLAVGNALSSGDLADGQTITTQQGEDITVTIDGDGNVSLNGNVAVTVPDREGINGVIHIIDEVLLPPSYQ